MDRNDDLGYGTGSWVRRDQARLLDHRVAKPARDSRRQLGNREHDWQTVTLGRICTRCHFVQARDEFDDQTVCAVGS